MRCFKIIAAITLAACVLLLSACSREGPSPGCLTCPEEHPAAIAARTYIEGHLADFDLRDQFDEMLITTVDEDQIGWTHVRFDQHYLGVHVIQGELIVHLDTALVVQSVSGATVPGIDLDVSFQVSSETALATALDDFSNEAPDGEKVGYGELVVYRLQVVDHLCWRYEIRSATQLAAREYFVSAHSGEIVYSRSLVIE
ncbi:MAG: hypothetical protein ACE5FH_11025 [Candidatus Zixiibacteriota bacterium]